MVAKNALKVARIGLAVLTAGSLVDFDELPDFDVFTEGGIPDLPDVDMDYDFDFSDCDITNLDLGVDGDLSYDTELEEYPFEDVTELESMPNTEGSANVSFHAQPTPSIDTNKDVTIVSESGNESKKDVFIQNSQYYVKMGSGPSTDWKNWAKIKTAKGSKFSWSGVWYSIK